MNCGRVEGASEQIDQVILSNTNVKTDLNFHTYICNKQKYYCAGLVLDAAPCESEVHLSPSRDHIFRQHW